MFMGCCGPRMGGLLFQIFALYALFTNYGWKRCLTWFVVGYGGGWLQVIIDGFGLGLLQLWWRILNVFVRTQRW